jgi:7,8-dihydropterin-6-yl-methyl-4-(beta-D-ribofuranosyl)aminobenzene 5'-phosphate synthase
MPASPARKKQRTMKVTCLVDNAVQPRSTLWGEHGLAFLIETQGRRVLFDTGASGTVLVHNLLEMNTLPNSMTALALSHAHYDHTGGLGVFLELRPGLPLYAHPDLLRERFSRRDKDVKAVGLRLTEPSLRRLADLRLSAAAQEILPGVWTTGEIAERPEPEGRSPHHCVRDANGWAPDSYQDDMALVLDSPAGLVLLCGCCHAGLLNTLTHVRRAFGRDPVAVVGGTHLVNADADHLYRLMKELGRLGTPALYLNHCTGLTAYLALALAFGEKVHPCPAGTILEF